MTLVNGQLANQGTFNNAFVSRTTDTSTEGKFTLENVDSNTIADIQAYTNELADVLGVTGEADPLKNDYSSNNYVTDGTSRKVAIGALDTSLKTVDDDLQAHKASTANPHSTTPAQIGAYTIAETNTAISTAITNLIDGAPATLDTLNELAAALNDDASFAGTVTSALAGKEPTITAATSADYYRGDKTFQTLNSTAVGLGNVTNDAQLKRAAGDINTFTEKLTVAADDLVLIEDSADTFNKKKVKMSNMGGGSGSGVASWLTATAYTVGQVVTYNRQLFLCLTAHTAGASFETDLVTNTYWVLTSKQDNYMQVGSTFESGTANGWNDLSITGYTAGTFPPNNLTIGSAAAVDTSTPISGIASLKNTTATTWTAGTGLVSPKVTIDKAVLGKVVTINFDYWISAGSSNMSLTGTSTNTYHVVIWDAANAAWIQPTNTYGISSIGPASWQGTFQVPTNATYFYVGLLVANANTSGTTTIIFDNFYVGRVATPTGAVMTDWKSYTLTIGGATTAPTPGTNTSFAFWRRVGDTMEIRYEFSQTTAGSGGTGVYKFPLPSGYTADSSKVGGILGAGQSLGSFTAFNGTLVFEGHVQQWDTTNLYGYVGEAASNTSNISSTFLGLGNATIRYGFEAKVPIVGWSSNVQLSSDAGNSIQAFKTTAVTTTTASGTTYTAINISGTVFDKAGMIGTNQILIQSPGVYSFDLEVNNIPNTATGLTSILFSVNGVDQEEIGRIIGNTVSVQAWTLNTKLDLKAGDVITVKHFQNTGASRSISFQLSGFKLSNPQTIAANDTIAASYYLSANQGITANSTRINYDTKIFDYQGSSVTTGAGWAYTAQTPGLYSVEVRDQVASSSTAYIVQTGSISAKHPGSAQSSGGLVTFATFRMIVGDQFYVLNNTNQTISGGIDGTIGYLSKITVKKIGNY